jgi:DNA-binding LacI/PurR family transcriptional regulator
MHLGGDKDEQADFHVQDQRLKGMREALASAGLSHSEDFRQVPYSIQGGYEGALAILADPGSRPTAIVAGCDEVAIGAIVAARQLGIHVPTQLSVIGLDGHTLAPMFGLTTLEQFPSRQGAKAVELVLGHRTKPSPDPAPRRLTMPVSLAVRTSTTAPPADDQSAVAGAA